MEIGVPRIRAGFPTRTTQEAVCHPSVFCDVAVTLCGPPFQTSLKKTEQARMTVRRPHFPAVPGGIRFELDRFQSPLLTASL